MNQLINSIIVLGIFPQLCIFQNTQHNILINFTRIDYMVKQKKKETDWSRQAGQVKRGRPRKSKLIR